MYQPTIHSRASSGTIRQAEQQDLECDLCHQKSPDVHIVQTGGDIYVELVNLCEECENNYSELTL